MRFIWQSISISAKWKQARAIIGGMQSFFRFTPNHLEASFNWIFSAIIQLKPETYIQLWTVKVQSLVGCNHSSDSPPTSFNDSLSFWSSMILHCLPQISTSVISKCSILWIDTKQSPNTLNVNLTVSIILWMIYFLELISLAVATPSLT